MSLFSNDIVPNEKVSSEIRGRKPRTGERSEKGDIGLDEGADEWDCVLLS